MKKENKTPRNNKGEFHGYWENYYPNGDLHYKGNYVNDNPIGYWEYYDSFGHNLMYKLFYIL